MAKEPAFVFVSLCSLLLLLHLPPPLPHADHRAPRFLDLVGLEWRFMLMVLLPFCGYSLFIVLHVQGFVKESIRINFVSASRVVRVVGERSLNSGNRISLFEQTFPVPENCEVQKLQGKFEHGTLIITMPKRSISYVAPKAQVEPPKKKGPIPFSPSKTLVHEQKPKEPNSPRPTITTRMGKEPIIDDNNNKKPQNVEEETMLKSTFDSTPKKQTSKSHLGQNENESKPTLTMDPSNPIEENQEKAITKYIKTVKEKLQEVDEKKSATKYIDSNEIIKGKEIKTRKGSPKEVKSSNPKSQEKEKETSTIYKEKRKEGEIYTIGKGIKQVVASTSEVVTRIGEGNLNDEEKPLVANMGAAILVIVALGAYVTYKFASSERI